jgi:zinc transporter 1/2/3
MVDTLLLGKIGFIIVIFSLALATGMIPIKCKGFKESPKIIGIANAFSGGVFLSIALVHILPDVTGSYQEYMETNNPTEPGEEPPKFFPLPYLLVFCGYSFILMVDKVMFDSHALIHDHDGAGGHVGHSHSHEHDHD